MLDRGSDYPAARRIRRDRARDREVVRLSPAAGKDDAFRGTADQLADLCARLFELTPRRLTRAMDRRGITMRRARGKIRDRVAHRRSYRRTRVMIEIDSHDSLPTRAESLSQASLTGQCPPVRKH